MKLSWANKWVRITAIAAPTLTLVLCVAQVVWLSHNLGVARAELEAVHAELSSVKPWAKSYTALTQTLSLIPQATQSSNEMNKAPTFDPVRRRESQVGLERRYGRANSLFTLIVYSDPECPFCKQYNTTPKSLVDGSGGNISLVFKHVPLHQEASRIESLAAECAAEQGGNAAFFKMLDAIFANTRANGNGVTRSLANIASDVGLDPSQMSACIDADKYMPKLSADLEEASKIGIDKTPTTVVRNNKTGRTQIIPGVSTPEVLMQAMASLVDQ